MAHNRYDLSRYIPSEIKRFVRKRCCFGCVTCGNAVCHYEHIDPTFVKAKKHDPYKIALLCGVCHDKVNRQIMSKATVAKCLQNPRACQDRKSQEAFDISSTMPTIWFCGTQFINVKTVIAMMGEEVLSIKPPECPAGPMRISGLFCDSAGKEIFRIINNEWIASSLNWDVDVQGRRIFVRRAPGDIALVIRTEPPDTIAIERMALYYKGAHIIGQEGGVIDAKSPSGSRITVTVGRVIGNGSGVGLWVDEKTAGFGYNGEFAALKASRAAHNRVRDV